MVGKFSRFLMYGISKRTLFKIILALLIVLFGKNVFASEFNMNSYTSATKNGTTNRYRATEIYNTGTSNTYTFGTQYSGRISDIETYFNYPFSANTTYTLTYNMNTEDFRNNFGSSYWWDCSQSMTNNNATVQSVSYINMKKVKFTFTTGNDATSCIRVWLRSSNVSTSAITGVSNWRLNSITIYDPEWQNGTSSSTGSQGTSSGSTSGTSSTNNNSDVINNATENTQNIINNQNSNTLDIIDNANQNTQDIINNNSTSVVDSERNNLDTINNNCGFLYKYNTKIGKAFYSNGSQYDLDTSYYTDDYIDIQGATKLVLQGFSSNNYNTGTIIIYDSNKNYVDYWGVRDQSITLPSNAKYFRIATTVPSGRIFKDKGCTSKLDENTNAINDLNDSINNDNVDSGTGTSFFDDFNTTDNGGISAIITSPLRLINAFLDNNSSCSNLQLPSIFGLDNITLPSGCILWNNAPNVVIVLWNTLIGGPIAYLILRDLFYLVEDMKDPTEDRIDVIDL